MVDHDRADRQRLLPLWFGMLGPPIIWGARFGASYVLVPYACARDTVLLLQLVTLVALLATAGAGFVAWRQGRAARKRDDDEPAPADTRTRFMALAGVLSSGLFFLVIAAEGLALFFVDPCQTGGAPL